MNKKGRAWHQLYEARRIPGWKRGDSDLEPEIVPSFVDAGPLRDRWASGSSSSSFSIVFELDLYNRDRGCFRIPGLVDQAQA